MERPLSITIIGIIFILYGIWGIFDFIFKLANDEFFFNLTALMLPVGLGLLKGLPSSRIWAKRLIILFCALLALISIIIFLGASGGLNVTFTRHPIGFWSIVNTILSPAIFIWTWITLSSSRVDSFFGKVDDPDDSAGRTTIMIAGITGALALAASAYWDTLVSKRSDQFSGPDFSNESKEVCTRVFAKLDRFLETRGFRRCEAPGFGGGGFRNMRSPRIWFEKEEDEKRKTYLFIDHDERQIRTTIRWEAAGFHRAVNEAEREILQFALEIDDWFQAMPEKDEGDDPSKQKRRLRWEKRIAELPES